MNRRSANKGFYRGLTKDALWRGFLSAAEEHLQPEAPSLAEWAVSTPIVLDGKPFSFERHEYLREPYETDHPFVVEQKSTQMGCTTRAILRALHSLKYRGFKGVMYFLPSRTDAIDLSKSRISPLIEENPEAIGRWLKDTDSAGLKRIGSGFFYVRGLISRVGVKSAPSDFNIYDELDEAPQSALDMAQERLAHSEFKETLALSNPTLPDYGVNRLFQETDQRYWLLKCPSCGHYTDLLETFPGCLIETKDKVIRGCERCKSELDPAIGEWVAKKPGVTEKRGYHYSQLFSQYVEPGEILHQYRTTTNLQDFHNLKLGLPYVEAQNRLSVEEVLVLCSNYGIASSDPGPCFMGVDQGKDLHVVLGKRDTAKAGRIIHLEVYKDWEELDGLMKRFNVSRAVVDALPETRNARAFAEKHKGRVFLCYYSEHQKGSYKWNERELTVTSNRTESLDASHNEIMNAQLVLPKECEITREFAKHLHNVAKKLEEDEETGSKRYVYVRLGPDHFRHAFNYECIARQYGKDSVFADCDLS